jgi:hypothetical protein
MRMYTLDEVNELIWQVLVLDVKIYPTTEVRELEVLIKHKLLENYATPVIYRIPKPPEAPETGAH